MPRDFQGDIFLAPAEALVNPVNCVGVMGKGLARQFKQRFPANFHAYRKACREGLVRPGNVFIFDTGGLNPRFIINFPTKRHWRDRSRLEDIQAGLRDLPREVVSRGICSVAVPPIGCGLGGLKWTEVSPLIRSFAQVVAATTEVILVRPPAKASRTANLEGLSEFIPLESFNPRIEYVEYDGNTAYLVDEEGDENHERSRWYRPDGKPLPNGIG